MVSQVTSRREVAFCCLFFRSREVRCLSPWLTGFRLVHYHLPLARFHSQYPVAAHLDALLGFVGWLACRYRHTNVETCLTDVSSSFDALVTTIIRATCVIVRLRSKLVPVLRTTYPYTSRSITWQLPEKHSKCGGPRTPLFTYAYFRGVWRTISAT